jgi:hypothetical protein
VIWRRVASFQTEVSEERVASIFRAEEITHSRKTAVCWQPRNIFFSLALFLLPWRWTRLVFRIISHILHSRSGLVVRVSSHRFRGPGFDSRRYQIFWAVVGLERGPLSLVSTTQGLLERKRSDLGLESREYGRRDPSCWPLATFYPQKLPLTSPTSGGRLVSIVRSRTSFFFSMVSTYPQLMFINFEYCCGMGGASIFHLGSSTTDTVLTTDLCLISRPGSNYHESNNVILLQIRPPAVLSARLSIRYSVSWTLYWLSRQTNRLYARSRKSELWRSRCLGQICCFPSCLTGLTHRTSRR